jgi:hypothetical protein
MKLCIKADTNFDNRLHDCYFEKLGYPIVDKSILEEVRVEL